MSSTTTGAVSITAGGGAGSVASRSGGGGSVAQPAKATATTSALSKRGVHSIFFKEILIVSKIRDSGFIFFDDGLD
jgi:hypothetical protein